MTTVTTSKQFTINFRDVLKGLLMAVLVPVVTIIMQSVDKGELKFDWKAIGIAAVGGFLGYLIKNFLTPSQIIIPDPHPSMIEQIQADKAEVKILPK